MISGSGQNMMSNRGGIGFRHGSDSPDGMESMVGAVGVPVVAHDRTVARPGGIGKTEFALSREPYQTRTINRLLIPTPTASREINAAVTRGTVLCSLTVDALVDIAVNHTDFLGDLVSEETLEAVADAAVEVAADLWADAHDVSFVSRMAVIEARDKLIARGTQMLRDAEDRADAERRDAFDNCEIDADGEPISQWNDWRDPRGFR